jgi:hypothetical protein
MKHEEELIAILKKNTTLWAILEKAPSFGLKNYYIGAGVISQTVWNAQNDFPLLQGISDVDFVYFDPDLSYEKEDYYIHLIQKEFALMPRPGSTSKTKPGSIFGISPISAMTSNLIKAWKKRSPLGRRRPRRWGFGLKMGNRSSMRRLGSTIFLMRSSGRIKSRSKNRSIGPNAKNGRPSGPRSRLFRGSYLTRMASGARQSFLIWLKQLARGKPSTRVWLTVMLRIRW